LRAAYPRRKKLSPNITTPQMDSLIEKALANGAIAAKVCGAGGGGCIAFFCEDGEKSNVQEALAAEPDAQVLRWKLSEQGLTVREL
jgi:D-glycero-alpha-D-manno-heptose-7-phosphate kinase